MRSLDRRHGRQPWLGVKPVYRRAGRLPDCPNPTAHPAGVQEGISCHSPSVRRCALAAIYAGGGKIWHASNPRTDVKLAKIWTSKWVAGRVR